MYTIHGYGQMIADRVRMDAYSAALRRTVYPGASVLDLGAGTGIMTLLACKLGAARVIAIEPSNLIAVAREMVRVAEWGSRVEFVQEVSTAVANASQCDVVVSDLRGVLPLFGHHIAAIVDARTRWLTEGGTLIPQQDTIYVAVVESPANYESHFSGWLNDGDGLPFAAARRLCANSTGKLNLKESELLSRPAEWTTLDYRTVAAVNHERDVTLEVTRNGTGHGLALWFESVLVEGVELSNRPGRPQLVYGQLFLPWPEPVALHAGAAVQVYLRARLIGTDYL